VKKTKSVLAGTVIAGALATQGPVSYAQTGSSNEVSTDTTMAISSARLYWEAFQIVRSLSFDPRNVTISVAVSVFPDELYAAPRNWAEKAYPKLIFYKKHDKGGHFAAWEQPQLLTKDLRAAFRPLWKSAEN
jgi:hypothetical protein